MGGGMRPAVLAALLAVAGRLTAWDVLVSAYDGDLESRVVAKSVPARHFVLDEQGKPRGLEGPRVRIELPERVALSINSRTFGRSEATVEPPCLPQPDPEGSFLCPDGSAQAAMSSAFVWACRTIDAMERWAGQPIRWGENGQLGVVACAFVTDSRLSYYDGVERRVYLGAAEGLVLEAARSPDTVIHECAHAALAALKPGHWQGMAVAIHEGIADAASFLVALEDPAVEARVLSRSGGDLHGSNELSRFCETGVAACRRALDACVAPADCGVSSADVDLPAGPLMTAEDPRNCHRVGQIVSGALYELLVSLCRRGITLPAARDAVGALMLRALTFVPEHRVSLRDYACALVRADGLLLDSACGEALAAVLARRGLVGGSGEARSARLPEFRLAPDLTDSEAILLRLEELERAQLRRVEAIEWTCREERNLVPLLRHRATAFVAEEVGRDELALLEDTTTSDGLRILRLGYRKTQAVVEDHDDSGIPRAQQARTACEGYASLVFDAEGTLVDFHADRPLE